MSAKANSRSNDLQSASATCDQQSRKNFYLNTFSSIFCNFPRRGGYLLCAAMAATLRALRAECQELCGGSASRLTSLCQLSDDWHLLLDRLLCHSSSSFVGSYRIIPKGKTFLSTWNSIGGSPQAFRFPNVGQRQKSVRPACAQRRSVTKGRDLVDLVHCPKPLPFVAVAEDVKGCPIRQ